MYYLKFNILLLYLTIILLINVKCYTSFNVNFHYNYDLKVDSFNTEIHERELQELYDKTSYNFNGFEKVYSIPVVYPVDICLLTMENAKHAVALHAGPKDIRHVVVFKVNNDSYEQIASIPKPNAISIDCLAFQNKGYVAIVLNITQPIRSAEESSCIYEIAGDQVQPIQYFTTPYMLSIYLLASDNNFFMLQTFSKKNATCLYFIWSGEKFSKLGNISCTNVRNVAAFTMDREYYIAIANYKDQSSPTERNSEIYKFSEDIKEFVLFQTIETNGAIDVQYFNHKLENRKTQHYLVIANSLRNHNQTIPESIIYLYNNGSFETFKKLPLEGIKKLLPIQHMEAENVLLLAALEDQAIKVFTLENGQVFESHAHFAAEAFGEGIANMRCFWENGKSYLVIANQQIMGNKSNVFQPRFKQDQRTNVLRQQLVDWVETKSKKLEQIDVKDLNTKLEKKLQLLDKSGYKSKRDLENSNIKSVITENLIYPKMKMSTNYWKALYYINQAVELLERHLNLKHQQERSKRNANNGQQYENLEYLYDSLDVNTLTVNQELKAKFVNKVNVENPELLEVHVPKIVVKGKYIEPSIQERYNTMANQNDMQDSQIIEIQNLQINGKLNDYTWNDLLNYTLKRNAEIQFIKSPVNIRNLETQRLVVTSKVINDQHLGGLIPIDGGEYVINQDIQFAAPVAAKNVFINERLNNVHVHKGKFDVLLKRANETQIIEGAKNLNNVKVMEPITIAGQLLGKHLVSITPNKAVHDPLILQGDFMINGNVGINQMLKVSDIIDLRGKMSVKQTLDNGIRMDLPVTDVQLKFLHTLKVNNSRVSFVNENDLQRLVKLNHDEIQIVEGEKTFENSLEIRRGFSEVKNLNGIDMEKLEKNSFLKHTNQTIKIPMKFGKIQANSVEGTSILLNNRNITDYLTKTGNQTIQGNLIVNNLKANTLKVERLNTNNRIFHQNLHDIYQQKSRNAPQEDVFLSYRKFHGSVYVQNLILNSTINNRNVNEIENSLLQLEGNIKYVGNFKFNYPLNIKKLTFYGKLNDIKAEDLGKCWLQKKGQMQQDFLGPQAIANVNAKKGIRLQGKINDFTIDEFFSRTYWINRDEYLPDIVFENPIEMTAGLNTATLNSQFVPDELLCHSNSAQFFQPLVIDGDLEIVGKISNVSIVNHVNLHALEDYLHGGYTDTLYVENANFSHGPPSYKTLNRRSIPQTLDSVWLANENVVLPQNIILNNTYFDGLLLFEGPINNMNLEYLKDNYLSKSKAQDISVEMVFDKEISCASDVESSDIELFGPIVEGKSGIHFNFMQFVDNTLKTSGPHIITGNWSILEAIVDGDLTQVLVNELNLVTDIVHNIETTQPYNIKSAKIFRNATIEHLLANPLSTVNSIPIANWINDAVYLYENYTIYGSTTLESLNVYNDLCVSGKLNNIEFNENTLLLQDRDQTFPGNLRISSHLINEKRFLTNNIENMHTDFVNSEYIPTFMENIMSLSRNPKIESHVVFKKPLRVQKYQGPDGMLTQTQWVKRSLQQRLTTDMENEVDDLLNFEQIEKYLRNITKASPYAVDHFEIRQSLKVNASQIMMFCLKTPTSGVVDLFVVVEGATNDIKFYKWLPESKQFEKYIDFNWLPMNPVLLNVIQKLYDRIQEPVDIEYLQGVVINIPKILYNPREPINQVEFLNKTCIVTYKTGQQTSNDFQIHCLDAIKQQFSKVLKVETSSNIRQLLPLSRGSIAAQNNKSVEIWNISTSKPKLLQTIPMITTKPMAVKVFKQNTYLAVIPKIPQKATTLYQGSIEIFRSFNGSGFLQWQTLSIPNPINLEFSYVADSQDLLLHVVTHMIDKPLIIYQYQGVMGFQEILTNSILPANGFNVKAFEIKSSRHHMVAVLDEDQISLVDIVLRKM